MTKDSITDYIVDTILEKEKSGARPLSVTMIEISSHFKQNAKTILREMVIEHEIYYGHTMNDIWFSIYKEGNLM